ncbi:MAG: hypothetical protein ACXQTI_10695 [Candidatus Nezhaarchaeales archaeon]
MTNFPSADLPSFSDLTKKQPLRLLIWYIFFLLLILIDEYVKEGYIFNPDEVLTPFTHEFLILVSSIATLIAAILIFMKRRILCRDHHGR